ncbi:Zinc finger mynd-type protein [Penicillium lagena]|uniref:Zinc finger mynd-type protein n=1 Tax=Penicillium lagena TaxID=94218 RepID=UPI0025409402|nr:Zinc finger mynd-type protein [Penicillium lagena]KAJ5604750.1 Zinc finger mynd-type protein [Penicillium lagena]
MCYLHPAPGFRASATRHLLSRPSAVVFTRLVIPQTKKWGGYSFICQLFVNFIDHFFYNLLFHDVYWAHQPDIQFYRDTRRRGQDLGKSATVTADKPGDDVGGQLYGTSPRTQVGHIVSLGSTSFPALGGANACGHCGTTTTTPFCTRCGMPSRLTGYTDLAVRQEIGPTDAAARQEIDSAVVSVPQEMGSTDVVARHEIDTGYSKADRDDNEHLASPATRQGPPLPIHYSQKGQAEVELAASMASHKGNNCAGLDENPNLSPRPYRDRSGTDTANVTPPSLERSTMSTAIDGRCTMCNLPGLLCDSFNHFITSPLSTDRNVTFKRAILFPADAETPRFVWLKCTLDPKGFEFDDSRSMLGDGHVFPGRNSVKRNPVREKELDYNIEIVHRDDFKHDGSRINESILTATQQKTTCPWAGNVVAVRREGSRSNTAVVGNMTMEDFRHTTDYLSTYASNPQDFGSSPKQLRQMDVYGHPGILAHLKKNLDWGATSG